jgi:hypothetical protein
MPLTEPLACDIKPVPQKESRSAVKASGLKFCTDVISVCTDDTRAGFRVASVISQQKLDGQFDLQKPLQARPHAIEVTHIAPLI